MTPIEGVDYAWNPPSVSGLAAAQKQFAVRYGGPGSASKQLTAGELRALKAAGIAVVANAEGAAGGFRGTAAGRSWASSALDHFASLGMPDDRPIYYSVDWDAGPGDWADIDAALRGAASVTGAARVGVYGGYNTIAHCASAGTARWFWQTYAWSGGRWHPAAHMQQYRNSVTLAGGDVDLTRAMVADFGQWGVDDMPFSTDDKAFLKALFAGEHTKTPLNGNDGKPDGTNGTPNGTDVWLQGIPNAVGNGERVAAYKLLGAIGSNLMLTQQAVAKVLANVTADDGEAQSILSAIQSAQAATVKQLIDQLTAAGRSDEDVAAALRAALGDRAAAIGALLARS